MCRFSTRYWAQKTPRASPSGSGGSTTSRELRGTTGLISVEPQVFDLLTYLVRNRDRVVSKDDILAAVWHGRIVSESALTTRINAVRTALGDSGEAQRLIKTLPRKGLRFVGPAARPPTWRGQSRSWRSAAFGRRGRRFRFALGIFRACGVAGHAVEEGRQVQE